jgi:hypothetical protein
MKKQTKLERALATGEIVSMEPLKGSAKAPAVEPKATVPPPPAPKAPPTVPPPPVQPITCPDCGRPCKSKLALAIHAGFAHKAGGAKAKAATLPPAKVEKPVADTGLYSVLVPAENVAEIVTVLTRAGVREIRVVKQ